MRSCNFSAGESRRFSVTLQGVHSHLVKNGEWPHGHGQSWVQSSGGAVDYILPSYTGHMEGRKALSFYGHEACRISACIPAH